MIGSAARYRCEISSPLPSTDWTGPREDYAGRRQKTKPDPTCPTAGALMPRYHRQQGMTVSFADKARFATVTP